MIKTVVDMMSSYLHALGRNSKGMPILANKYFELKKRKKLP